MKIFKDVSLNLPKRAIESILDFKLSLEGYLIYLEFKKEFIEYIPLIANEFHLIQGNILRSINGTFVWYLYYERVIYDPMNCVLTKVNIEV